MGEVLQYSPGKQAFKINPVGEGTRLIDSNFTFPEAKFEIGGKVFDYTIRQKETEISRLHTNLSLPDVITKARDIYVAKEQRKNKTVIAYELDQDASVYQELSKHKGHSEYLDTRDSLNAYTGMQLKTHLGERLHVGISKFNFSIKNGELIPENSKEPMLSMTKRGRDYRRTHGKKVDWARESAEVFGVEEIQSVLGDRETPLGTMMLLVSPPGDKENGSIYKQNFYDVYQKTVDGVVAYRFTSGLTPAESQAKVRRFDLRYANDTVPTDSQFLARPIRLDPQSTQLNTPQEVHAHMHKKHTFMTGENFDKVIKACEPLIKRYIDALCEDPYNFDKQGKIYTALLNYADDVAESLASSKTLRESQRLEEHFVRPWNPSQQDIDSLSEREVRKVDTACGPSGSVKKGQKSPYSVLEFSKDTNGDSSEDYEFDHDGVCVSCNSGPKKLGPCELCISCDAKMGGKGASMIDDQQDTKKKEVYGLAA